MFIKAVPATSLLFRAIRRALGVQDPPLVDASRLLPAPNATAATWDRHRHVCLVCGQEMTLIPITLDGTPQYRCLPCDGLVAEQAHKDLETIRNRTGKLPIGAINQIYRTIAPGTIARDAHHAQQEEMLARARRNIISALDTNRELHHAPEVAELATLTPQRHQTGPLPARDIVYAPTSRVDISQMITIHPVPNLATPLPSVRESLFTDVPEHTAANEQEEEDDVTERRRIVRIAPITVQIPTMNAEVLLEAMMQSKTSERNTGETEQVTVDAWLR